MAGPQGSVTGSYASKSFLLTVGDMANPRGKDNITASACFTGRPVYGWAEFNTTPFLPLYEYFQIVTITFGVAIILRMVLGFFVKRNFQVLSDVLPFCRRWILESGSQLDCKLKTVGFKKWTIFRAVNVYCMYRYQWWTRHTWIWPQRLCTQSCWHCSSTHQVASHLNVPKGT